MFNLKTESGKHISVGAIVLAAGKGTRMKSDLPKVLHQVAGRAMLARVIDTLKEAGLGSIAIVLGPERQGFEEILADYDNLCLCEQTERKGTADAAAAAAVCFSGETSPEYSSKKHLGGEKISADYILVCTGDAPAILASELRSFMEQAIRRDADLSILGMRVPEPTGYGRLICAEADLLKEIVEEKDASSEQKKIDLCNSGVIFCKREHFFPLLSEVTPHNKQSEYYLTDIVALARQKGYLVTAFQSDDWQSFLGVNDQLQRKQVEDLILKRQS